MIMKNLFYILFLFFSVLSFGQPVYKITEGEVQFIHLDYGIILKKDNLYYKLNIEINYYDHKKELTLEFVAESEIKELLTSEKTIFYKDIDENYNFEKLKELSFLYTYDDKETIKNKKHDIYKFCQFNQNYFAIFQDRHDEKNIYTSVEEVMPYMFIEFGNKKIIFTYKEHYYLIPAKNKLKIFQQRDNDYLPFHKTEKLKLSNKEIYEFSQYAHYDLKDEFFVVDTLPNKKVRLKNIYDEILINQNYDSIILSPIIKCYNNNKIDLYNLTYKKLNKIPLKASKGGLGSVQILEKNKIKQIDWTGKQIKKGIYYPLVSLPEAPQYEYYYEVEIFKKDTDFVFKAKNFSWFAMEHDKTEIDTLNLINTKGIKRFYFKSNISKDTVSNNREFYSYDNFKPRITDIITFDYEIIHFQKKDGTYGMNYLGKFLKNPHFKEYIEYVDFEQFDEYQNLQLIEYKYPFYRMKKNNLYKLYPLQKDFRYKKLKDFQGNFARFELPNGQKGWLDLQGNEYLDE